jgi:hypothetical protein
VSTFPSEYIIAEATLAEVSRVLRPGGRLVVVPAGWITSKDAQGKAFEGVARLVYGNSRGGPSAPIPAQQGATSRHTGWVGVMEGTLREAGFDPGTYLASNRRGSAVVVVAVKR